MSKKCIQAILKLNFVTSFLNKIQPRSSIGINFNYLKRITVFCVFIFNFIRSIIVLEYVKRYYELAAVNLPKAVNLKPKIDLKKN